MRNFTGLARLLFAVPVPQQEKGLPADVVADAARRIGIAARSQASVEHALKEISRLDLDPAPRILITGSLYLAGAVLSANGTPPQ